MDMYIARHTPHHFDLLTQEEPVRLVQLPSRKRKLSLVHPKKSIVDHIRANTVDVVIKEQIKECEVDMFSVNLLSWAALALWTVITVVAWTGVITRGQNDVISPSQAQSFEQETGE